jgi:hypothetical protein
MKKLIDQKNLVIFLCNFPGKYWEFKAELDKFVKQFNQNFPDKINLTDDQKLNSIK